MLLLLPLILFGLICVALGVLRLRGMRMAYLWLLPAFIALVCWITYLILPVPVAASLIKIPALFSQSAGGGLAFSLDANSWGFIFLVISLVLVYFLTLLIRLEQEKRSLLWIGWLLLSMTSILSFTAANLTTLIVTWTLFDLMDFLFTFFVLRINDPGQSLVKFFQSRVISVALLILVGVFLQPDSPQWLPAPLSTAAYFLLFSAALFRSGLLPFKQNQDGNGERGVSFAYLKRITLVLSSFSLLSILPINYLTPASHFLLSAIFFILSLLFLILLLRKHQAGSDLWLNSIICLGCISCFSGTPISLLGWAGVAMLGTGMLQFYSLRSPRLNVFALMGALSLSGLPFTIGAFALAGLSSANSWAWLVISLPPYSLLLFDFVHRILLPGQENGKTESVFLAVYLFGLFLLAFSPFAILIKNAYLAANVLKYWWSGVVVLFLLFVFYWLTNRIRTRSLKIAILEKGILPIVNLFGFDWLNIIWQRIEGIFSGLFEFLTQLLEGEGGIIWAVVILALLVSLISVGRS
jgi:hypothetical protein